MEKNVDAMMNAADLMTNQQLQPFAELISQILDFPEEDLNQNIIDMISGMIDGAFTPGLHNETVQQTLNDFREQQYNRKIAREKVDEFKNAVNDLINELNPSAARTQLLQAAFKPLIDVFEDALEHFNLYDFVLPIKLDEGAQVPTYAHEDDAAADLYAADDVTLPAHSISNMVRTGVHIALPEGWAAIIIPRSSIGAKTGLRLSNSQGLIDTSYRGPLGVIYDNISDSAYEIKKGDRIAQMYVVPVHRFKAQVVDELDETDRNDGGFGSTGK